MPAPLLADFSVQPTAFLNEAVQFTDLSYSDTGFPLASWRWYFGDGNESLEQNPKHVYTVLGPRTIRLDVTDTSGAANTLILVDEISVIEDLTMDVSQCDTSFRYAITPDQGVGFALNAGSFPMPSAHADTLNIVDANGYDHALVYDAADGLWYDISTRDGAAGSGLVKTWVDKEVGGVGVDVQPVVLFPEDIGEQDYFMLESVESHIGFRAEDETLRNTTGYDAKGFPTGLQVTMSRFVDGAPAIPASISQAIPLTGDVADDQHVRAKRVQTKISTNKGRHLLVYRNQLYNEKDVANDPDTNHQTEADYQAALANVALWMTRGPSVNHDLVSGKNFGLLFSGSYQSPDGSACAIRYASDADLLMGGSPIRDFLGWAKVGVGQYVGGDIYHRPISNYTPLVTVASDSGTWGLYLIPGAAFEDYILSPGYWFDIRLYSQGSVSAAAAAYLGSDTINFGGKNTLPIWTV